MNAYSGTTVKTITSWVYLFRREKKGLLCVGYSLHLPEELKGQEEDFHLLYYRRFHNITDSLGHKLLLEQLSADSLKRVVRKMNPREKDLKHELLNQ